MMKPLQLNWESGTSQWAEILLKHYREGDTEKEDRDDAPALNSRQNIQESYSNLILCQHHSACVCVCVAASAYELLQILHLLFLQQAAQSVQHHAGRPILILLYVKLTYYTSCLHIFTVRHIHNVKNPSELRINSADDE